LENADNCGPEPPPTLVARHLEIELLSLIEAAGWPIWFLIVTSVAAVALIIERGLMSIDGWLLKGAASGHHPPEHYASPVVVVLTTVFLVLSMRGRPAEAA